jgi:hypothetical protein
MIAILTVIFRIMTFVIFRQILIKTDQILLYNSFEFSKLNKGMKSNLNFKELDYSFTSIELP